jgi:WD40 repeat protein
LSCLRIYDHEKCTDINAQREKWSVEKHYYAVRAIDTVDNIMVTGSYDKSIILWDIRQSPNQINCLHAHTSHVTGIKLFQDHTIVSCSEDGSLRVFDVRKIETNKYGTECIHRVNSDDIPFISMSVSEDLSRIALNTDHNKILVLRSDEILDGHAQSDTINPVTILTGHLSANWATLKLQYFDQRMIACGSEDGALCVWDDVTGTLKKYPIHASCIWNTSYSPVTRTLITASEDGSCCLVDVATESPVDVYNDHEPCQLVDLDYQSYQIKKNRKRQMEKSPHLHQNEMDLVPCHEVLVRFGDGYYYHAEVIDVESTQDEQMLFTCLYRDYSTDDPEPVVTVGSSLVLPDWLIDNCSEECIDGHSVEELLRASRYAHSSIEKGEKNHSHYKLLQNTEPAKKRTRFSF